MREVPDSFRDVGSQGGVRPLRGAIAPAHPQQHHPRQRPHRATRAERDPRGRGEQEATQRRTGEVVADDLGAYSRLFASDRRSRSTIDGRIDWAEVSNSVSPMPSANAAT